MTDDEIDAAWDQWHGAAGFQTPAGPETRRGFARALLAALEKDGPHLNCWALRDVYFDEHGEPIAHRALNA
jgi:hypothetical protein